MDRNLRHFVITIRILYSLLKSIKHPGNHCLFHALGSVLYFFGDFSHPWLFIYEPLAWWWIPAVAWCPWLGSESVAGTPCWTTGLRWNDQTLHFHVTPQWLSASDDSLILKRSREDKLKKKTKTKHSSIFFLHNHLIPISFIFFLLYFFLGGGGCSAK